MYSLLPRVPGSLNIWPPFSICWHPHHPTRDETQFNTFIHWKTRLYIQPLYKTDSFRAWVRQAEFQRCFLISCMHTDMTHNKTSFLTLLFTLQTITQLGMPAPRPDDHIPSVLKYYHFNQFGKTVSFTFIIIDEKLFLLQCCYCCH